MFMKFLQDVGCANLCLALCFLNVCFNFYRAFMGVAIIFIVLLIALY